MKSVCYGSDRVITVQLSSKPIDIKLVHVYQPTVDSNVEELEKFYKDVKSVIDQMNSKEVIIVMEDFNTKVGEARQKNIAWSRRPLRTHLVNQ